MYMYIYIHASLFIYTYIHKYIHICVGYIHMYIIYSKLLARNCIVIPLMALALIRYVAFNLHITDPYMPLCLECKRNNFVEFEFSA